MTKNSSDTSSNAEIPQYWRQLFELIPGYDPIATAEAGQWFDSAMAEKAVAFIEKYCTHVKGKLAGKPILLEDWQKAAIGCLFGWKNADGTRRYRTCFIFIPRKNGKSVIGAAIALLLLIVDNEPGAEIYTAAAEKEQASLIWSMAMQMIRQKPSLHKLVKIYPSFKSITIERDGSFVKAVSAEAGSKHGYNPHGVLFDEVHVQDDEELIEAFETGMGARTQPLMVYMTTSDFERPSPCNRLHRYASRVRDSRDPGEGDASFLPVIFEASQDDDWTDPKVWRKANPNLGVSTSLEFLEQQCKKAQEMPAWQNSFKRLYLNIRTQQDVAWISMEKWDACAGEMDYRELREALQGESCFVGVDLGSTSDLTCASLFFPERQAVVPFFWVPRETALKRREKALVNYHAWEAEEALFLTDGDVIDYDEIRRFLNQLGDIYDIQEIAIDRWNATHITTQLTDDGFEMVPFGQGFASMSSPTKELEAMILQGELIHGNHPVLRWCANNVMIEEDAAGNMKPSKKKSTEKIDGVVALIMSIGRASTVIETGSVYDKDDILII